MGIIGEIHSNLLNKFDIKNEVVILFELELNKFIEFPKDCLGKNIPSQNLYLTKWHPLVFGEKKVKHIKLDGMFLVELLDLKKV